MHDITAPGLIRPSPRWRAKRHQFTGFYPCLKSIHRAHRSETSTLKYIVENNRRWTSKVAQWEIRKPELNPRERSNSQKVTSLALTRVLCHTDAHI